MDALDDLSAAIRLSRAVKDTQAVEIALGQILIIAEQQLDGDDPAAGVVLRALRLVIGEPRCSGDVDALIERAVTAWSTINQQDSALQLVLERATSEEERRSAWRRRVEAWLEAADRESVKVLRAVRLQQAMHLADLASDSELRRQAAASLQAVRREDLEMLSITATSRRYREEFELLVAEFSDGSSWQASLGRFATRPPLSGDVEANRQLIEQRLAAHPLGKMFPTLLLGPDGLPSYQGTDEADRFDVELVRWEAELISNWSQVVGSALHRVVDLHGLPEADALIEFLSLPWKEGRPISGAVARAMLRFWSGDSEGAIMTILPQIEAIIREMVLSSEQGLTVYRLQRERSPGQYAGLGYLIPLLNSQLHMSESLVRYVDVVLRHPAGFNMRNQLLHGFRADAAGPDSAAVLIHVTLSLLASAGSNPEVSIYVGSSNG